MDQTNTIRSVQIQLEALQQQLQIIQLNNISNTSNQQYNHNLQQNNYPQNQPQQYNHNLTQNPPQQYNHNLTQNNHIQNLPQNYNQNVGQNYQQSQPQFNQQIAFPQNHNPVQNYVNQVEESPILSISNRHQYDQYSENGSNNLPVERSRNNPVRIQEPVRMQRNGTGCRLCGETTHMARSCMKMTARIRRAIVRELDLCQICLNENNHSPEQCRMNNSQNRKRCNRCRVGPAHSYNICESHDEEENQVNQNEEVQEPRIEIIPEEVRMRMAPIPAEDRRAETSSEEDEESSMDEDEEESSEN
ncbi:unnamed protein product [Caenorhabditis nigoni]